jgi:alpha-amylase
VVKDIQTYNYTIVTFTPTKATVYVHCDTWSPLYFYAWDDNGQLNGGWPGKAATATKVIDNKTWYYQTFDVTGSSYKFNFIFSQNGTPQTVDITGINSDKYYELSSTKDGNGKYYVTDVTSTTGINGITTDNSASAKLVKVYTISGQLLRSLPKGTSVQNATDGLPHGIYIVDNKKIAK